MKQAELYALLSQVGLPVAYSHFKDQQELPFVTFIRTSMKSQGSDFKNELREEAYSIELYSETKDLISEGKLEKILDNAGLDYKSTEGYIAEEGMYQIAYDVEFYYKREE